MIFLRILKIIALVIGLLIFIGVMGMIMAVLCIDHCEYDDDDYYYEMEKKKMKTYIAHWYNEDQVVCDDGPFKARDEEEAKNIAYRRKNGNPPAPLLWLEEVK